MLTDNTAQKTERPEFQQLKAVLAVLLLALGIVGAIWIANQIIVLVTAPTEISLINKFMTLDAPSRVISTPTGNIELPTSFNVTIGVVLYLFVLSVALSMAKLFISSGVALLESQVSVLLNGIRNELSRMRGMEK